MELKTKDISNLKFNNQRFSLTNGVVGLLGILEENAVKDTPVFTISDESEKKVLFNPLFTILKANDQLLSPKFQKPISHLQAYKLKEDILIRSTIYLIDGVKVTIDSERFIDENDMVIYTQYKFKTSDSLTVDLYHGIDDTCIFPEQGVMSLKSKLHEMTLKTSDSEYMVLSYQKDFRHKNRNKPNQPTEHYLIDTEPDRTYTITKVIGYGPHVRTLKKLLKYKLNQSYDKIRENHIEFKTHQFQDNRMIITNNKELELLLSYVYRQYFNKFPRLLSINQTGLDNYTQVIFYIFNNPDIAKQKLLGQIEMLKQFKKDAESLGYQGAIITDGVDNFNSGDRAIYKGALLIYLIAFYQQMTNDFSLIEEGALELAIEISRFYLDYGEMNSKKTYFGFNNVSNLNHTLNHINNHTLTNYLIRECVKITYEFMDLNKQATNINRYTISELQDLTDSLKKLYKKIYIQTPKSNHLLYPYKSFLIDKEKGSLEENNDSLNVLFDQLILFLMFNNSFNSKIISDNFKYYSELTKHADLNQILLNLISNDIIKDKEFTYLVESVSIKKESLLLNSGGIDLGVMGLVYMFMIYRLSGLRHDRKKITVDSLIPRNIRRLEFNIKYHQYTGSIKIKRNSAQLDWKY